MKMLKKLNTVVYSIILSAAIILPLPVSADDTDIYINTPTPGSLPKIMFTLDWRPNLLSAASTNLGADCKAALASAKAPPAPTPDATILDISTRCGWLEAFTRSLIATTDVSDATYNRSEYLRAVLRVAMAPLDGVDIGLMLMHDQSCLKDKSGPTQSGCSNGAYIRMGFQPVAAGASDPNKLLFLDALDMVPPVVAPGQPHQGQEVYFELFRYLTGQDVYNGHLGWTTFEAGKTPVQKNINLDGNDLSGTYVGETPNNEHSMWDLTIEKNGRYISPYVPGSQCSQVYVLNFMFGALGNYEDSNTAIKATYADGGMDNLALAQASGFNFNTVIQWMYKTDLVDGNISMQYKDPTSGNTKIATLTDNDVEGLNNVTSFFVVQSPSQTENGWAEAGGTGNAIAWSDDPNELLFALINVFNQILSVSSSFVSASVPVNVFNKAEFLDDVYIAIFEAEENRKPGWIGNLKKLKLTQDTNGFWYIGDVNKKPAFAADGRINYNALTFWTDTNGDDVSDANYVDTAANELIGFDGRSVNRGGAAQHIPGILSYNGTLQNGQPGLSNADSGARQVFTEPDTFTNGIAKALQALDATPANASKWWPYLTAAGVPSTKSATNVDVLNSPGWLTAADYASATAADQTEALDLLKYARGIDVADEDGDNSTTDPRPWIMSDPIHSRPLTINYGDSDGTGGYDQNNPDVRIIVTSNSGAVHMIRNTTSAGAESGSEDWAFYPTYALRLQKRLKDAVKGDPLINAMPLHPYGVDGAPTVYTEDVNYDGNLVAADGDKVYLFFGMRRGGQNYYGLDISDPDNPKMLWKITPATAGFSELGLTFARPILTRIAYDDGVKPPNSPPEPVLVFGNGYNVIKDTRSDADGVYPDVGAIYIVNAETGKLVWKVIRGTNPSTATTDYYVNLLHSIPAEIAVLDSDGDGSTDRLYAADTGGLIFRVNLPSRDRTTWQTYLMANLGQHTSGYKYDDRRFFHSVDVVQTIDLHGYFDAVIVGSGDRANPLDKGITSSLIPQNWFYMIKDRGIYKTDPPKFLGPDGVTYSGGWTHHTYLADLSDNCAQYPTANTEGCGDTYTTVYGTYSRETYYQNLGWKIKLEQAVGEKALSKPVTLGGIIFFTTYLPPETKTTATCGPVEGEGLTYAVNLQDATPAFNWDLTNTFTDSTGVVQDMAATDRFRHAGAGIPADVIGIRKGGLLQAVTPGRNDLTVINQNAGWKTFWYTEGD